MLIANNKRSSFFFYSIIVWFKISRVFKYSVSKCLLRHDGVRVFVSFCVLVFVRAILSWCP